MDSRRAELAANYCKVPPAEQDPVFALCYEAAVEYAAGAGVPEPVPDPETGETPPGALYDLLICMLASTWYDNRGTMVIGQTPEKLERTAQALILQLR